MMKIKRRLLQIISVAFAALFCLSPMNVHAMVQDESKEESGPLTPNGNLTLVDDYGSSQTDGKQFLTVITKNGNYFYIIIDRDENGNENVHFLNMVDESDLFSLMDEEEVQDYVETVMGNRKVETEQVPEPMPTPTSEVVKEEPQKESSKAGPLIFLLLFTAGGAGGYFYLQKNKKKETSAVPMDPDFDYNEEEEEYLSDLSEEGSKQEETEEAEDGFEMEEE